MDEFAHRLRYAIDRSDMQQKELAASIKLSPARLSNYVNGHSEPSLDILLLLCRELKVSADYLIGLTDNVTPSAVTPVSIAPLSVPRSEANPLEELDPDLRSKAEGYIDSLLEQQRERARELSGQEA
ncbi:MAG: helix-turn-helix transcriptional regulator [Clostridia bacterium]|nr:helix-turn-helix transcriptional regulator [Clostridia bacterium]